jgi:hypothetical protein
MSCSEFVPGEKGWLQLIVQTPSGTRKQDLALCLTFWLRIIYNNNYSMAVISTEAVVGMP